MTRPANTLATPMSGPTPPPAAEPPARRPARALRSLVGVLSLFAPACLFPPEAVVFPETPNTPPRIDFESMVPVASLFDVGLTCDCFRIKVRAYDDDGDDLQVRLATNVGRAGGRARCLEQSPLLGSLEGQDVAKTLVTSQHLAGFPSELVHTISVFVTDAPGFVTPVEAPDSGDTCGLVDDGDGIRVPGVVEARWTVRYVSGVDDCAGCGPGS